MSGLSVQKVHAFISYSHEDRHYGAQVKGVLAEFDIEAFLAHEDLHVSDEWRQRILEELKRCHLFVPLLSMNFLSSKWAPQEAGFIISRPEVLIFPLSIDGTTPSGFLSHLQSRRIPQEGITRELLVEPLALRMPRRILPGLISLAAGARSYRSAEANMRPLVPLFPIFNADETQALAAAAVDNEQIWSASLCRLEYLPEFIRIQSSNIKPNTLDALQYQVKHDRRYEDYDEPP